MKFSELLEDKLMGVYIEILKSDGSKVRGLYQGMKNGEFVIETPERLREGEEISLKLTVGGWNLVFPCKVDRFEENICFLKPSGKVKIREKRRERRIPCIVSCYMGEDLGTILDISYHGLRILTLKDFTLGEDVKISIGGKDVEGKVRWMKEEEVDLKSFGVFLDDPPKWWIDMVRGYLERYVEALRRL